MINRVICILLFIGLYFCNCSSKVQVDQVTFSKMVSARNLGIAYLEEERYSDAVKEFEILINSAPEEPLGYANLGLTYMRMNGTLEKSEEWLVKALEISPDNPDIRLLLAELYQLIGRGKDAIKILEETIKKTPDHIKTRYELALSYSQIRDPDSRGKAIEHMKYVANALPANVIATFKLVELLLKSEHPNEALNYLEIINQTLPQLKDGAEELLARVLVFLKNGDTKSAYSPVMILHNLLKPKSLYRASVEELEGTNGPFSGNPILRFLNTETPKPEGPFSIPMAVKFVDVTEPAGLNIGMPDNAIDNTSKIIFTMGDYDLDGDSDIFYSRWSETEKKSQQYLLNNNNGIFKDLTSGSGIKHQSEDIAAIFTDYDNDGYPDLFITNIYKNRLYKNSGNGEFELINSISLVSKTPPNAAVFADLDLEGDLDLFLTTKSENYLFQNNSDGTFIERGLDAGLNGENLQGEDIVYADFDDDGDVDLFVLSKNGGHQYFDNIRQGYFNKIKDTRGIISTNRPGTVIAGDYNNDGAIDLFISDLVGKNNHLYSNNGSGSFRLNNDWDSELNYDNNISARDAKFLDIDNNGFLDILISGETIDKRKRDTGIQLLYNNGLGKFIDASSLFPQGLGSFSQVEIVDYDGDGDLDVFLANMRGYIQLLRNDGGNLNNFLAVRLRGLRAGSGKNNYYGIGAKVEVKAGELYQLRYVNQPTIHFGLGESDGADVMRVLWSNGVPQNHFNPRSNQTIVEEQFLKGSCPYLFAWTGSKFEFMTDVLWPSALGMPLGIMAGETLYAFSNSTDEFLMIPGNKIQAKGGRYILQFTTELWETPYLDKIELLVIDHPDSVDVLIDEKFSPPPFPSARIYNFTQKHVPVFAEDHRGEDVLDKIIHQDKKYLSNFLSDKYQGVTELHDLIFGFEDLGHTDSLFLFLQGWLFPTDASINVNIAQSGAVTTVFPYLEVVDETGNWVMAEGNIGFPKGKNKTMVIDLTDKFISNDYRLRIRTTMQIYWDHIFISTNVSGNTLRTTKLKPVTADLHYRGFSKISREDFGSPHIPDYYDITTGQKWRDLIGNYTRYGDVLPLLLESDNKYVIMNSGDEITLNFNASDLPDIRDGWTRDFLFYNDGWLKDGDLNTARGQTVEPLPFHGMNSYPYSGEDDFPDNQENIIYQKVYNSRTVTTDSFRGYLKNK